MGMFDRLYDEAGNEWQTKAFDCMLDAYRVGDRVRSDTSGDYQVEILGGPKYDDCIDGLATIRDGVLVKVNDLRDVRLPLIGYGGNVRISPATSTPEEA